MLMIRHGQDAMGDAISRDRDTSIGESNDSFHYSIEVGVSEEEPERSP
jgi:hypothetical protein